MTRPEIDAVVERYAAEYGVSVDELRSNLRSLRLAQCRRSIAIELKAAGVSTEQIGAGMDKDGSAVRYMLRVERPVKAEEGTETAAQAQARVAADVASGRRCPKCWLLKPCNPDGEMCSVPTPAGLARTSRGDGSSEEPQGRRTLF